jgi:NAD(P)-dependent dehydrogenase (short-subunit alcohol dehydrogenase family)
VLAASDGTADLDVHTFRPSQFSEPKEHAGQVLLLLSEYSSYHTGSEIFIDGGYLIY